MTKHETDQNVRAAFDNLSNDATHVETMAALRVIQDRRRPRWMWGAVLGAAAAVLLIVVGIAVLGSGEDSSEQISAGASDEPDDEAGVDSLDGDGNGPADGGANTDDGGPAGPTEGSPDDDGTGPVDRAAALLDGTAWVLVSGTGPSGEVPIVDGWPITLTFDGDTIGGTAACNSYSGKFAPATGVVGDLFMTEIACRPDVAASEAAYIEALIAADGPSFAGNELILHGPSTELIFALESRPKWAALIGQLWLLDTLIQGETAATVSGDPATLLFFDDGSFEATTGCRTLSGQYVTSGIHVIPGSFGAQGNCPAELEAQDNMVFSVIEGGFAVEIDGDRLTLAAVKIDSDSLTLVPAGGEGLRYTAIDEIPDSPAAGPGVATETLDGSAWILFEGIDGENEIAVVAGSPITLTFDGDTLRGHGGCNGYGGSFVLSGASLAIVEIDQSLEGCEADVDAAESAYVSALDSVDTLTLEGEFLVLRGPGIELNFEPDD